MSGELQRHIRAQQKLAALEERNRLARDLHDTVKQQAFAAAMQLGAARTVLTGDNGPAGVFVSQAEKLVNKVQEDLMALIHELRPALGSAEAGVVPLAVSDLSALLRQEVLDWSQASSIPANVGDMAGISAPDDVCQALLRITQEALANVARHSQASQVAVEMLQRSDATIQITLTDNGQGFDPIFTPRGMGLYSMRDRALSLPDGRFSLETTPGAGVTIRVSCAGSSPSDE
jgi:NarL family two-component system sensor histidine kinase LiaS